MKGLIKLIDRYDSVNKKMPLGIYFKDYIFVLGKLRSLHANFIFLVDLGQCLFNILLKLVRL